MLFNRPPTGSGQIPGYTTAPTNRQSIPAFSATGEPSLETSPSNVTPVNQLPSPSAMANSSFSVPSFGNFAQSGNPTINPVTGTHTNSMMGNQPLGGSSGNMLTNAPPAKPTPNPPPAMGQYFNSSNPSTLMRSTVGNTTQSGASE